MMVAQKSCRVKNSPSQLVGGVPQMIGRSLLQTTPYHTSQFFLHLSPSPTRMHYNESRGYSGPDVEEESTSSIPMPLNLSALRSQEQQGQDVVYPGTQAFNVQFICHSPCLQHISLSLPFKDLGLCIGVFPPLLMSSFYLTHIQIALIFCHFSLLHFPCRQHWIELFVLQPKFIFLLEAFHRKNNY